MYDSDPERKSKTPLLTRYPFRFVLSLPTLLVSLRSWFARLLVRSCGEHRAFERWCTTYLSPTFPSVPLCKAHRTRRTRGGGGVGPSSECIRVSRRERAKPSSPFTLLSVVFLRGNLLGSLRPHVLCISFFLLLFIFARARKARRERREERRGRRETREREGGGRRELRILIEYIMMCPAVLRRLNGRVCVLCKR